MAIVRFDPGREVDSLQSEVNRVFDAFFGAGSHQATRRWVPAIDLIEREADLVLRADLPGLSRDDVTIEVKDGVLTLSGDRKADSEERAEGHYRIERAFGSFSRSLTLPRETDASAIAARFDNGVLEITIPKPAERKAQRVEIAARRRWRGDGRGQR